MDTTDLNTITDLLVGIDDASGYEVMSSYWTGHMEPGRKCLVVYYEDSRRLYLETHEPDADPALTGPGTRTHHQTHQPTATCTVSTDGLTRDSLHARIRAFAAHVAAGGTAYPVAPAEMLLADAGVPAYR